MIARARSCVRGGSDEAWSLRGPCRRPGDLRRGNARRGERLRRPADAVGMAGHAGGPSPDRHERAGALRPVGCRALARRPPRAGHVERAGGPGRDARDVRHQCPGADGRARDERPSWPLGLLRRRLLAGRQAGVGVGRRAGRPALLPRDPAGRFVPDGPVPAGHFPAGIAYGQTPLGDRLYVANNLGGDPFTTGAVRGSAGPPGHGHQPGHGPDHRHDRPRARRSTRSASRSTTTATKAYVTNWMGRSVSVIDTTAQRVWRPSGSRRPTIRSRPITHGDRRQPENDEIYTANAISDTVSVLDSRRDRLAATIDVALVPGAPKGSMPEGLAVSPDGGTLYVADAGENAVAVVDLRTRRVRGFIPTAWYPADVEGRSRRPPARRRQHQRLRCRPEPVRTVLAAPGPGMRDGHRVLPGLLREPVQRHDDPRVGAGDRPARRPRVRPPAAAVDGAGAPQQPRRRAACARAARR